MPIRDPYRLQQRNTAICNTFFHHLQSGMPCMEAYAQTGQDYFLSEEYIRQIVANKSRKCTIGAMHQQKG